LLLLLLRLLLLLSSHRGAMHVGAHRGWVMDGIVLVSMFQSS
jgi:hypothetical protein